MNFDSITSEIHTLIDEKIASGVLVQVAWVATEILDSKCSIEGDDVEFYRVCTFKEVSRVVKSAIGKYKAEDVTSDQLLFPGFKHLAKAYPFNRDGDLVLVPVDQCTDFELESRADELEKMAKGCREHAREIREYIMARGAQDAAA